MKIRYTVALSMLTGVAIGGAAIQTLHAQAKPPVYMVAINEIQSGRIYEAIPSYCSENDQGAWWRICRSGTGNAD
jgi:hypothetical protein